MIENSPQLRPEQTAALSAAAPIDRNVLLQLLEDIGGDTVALGGLLRSYLDDTPQLLQDMQQAISASDAPALAMAAHTLKSTSASIGATCLAALCEELNHTVRGGVPAESPVLYDRIIAEFERGRALLEAPPRGQESGIDVRAVLHRVG
jgi:HPt (histidine-containing phosphotransfer) domain-containing protein